MAVHLPPRIAASLPIIGVGASCCECVDINRPGALRLTAIVDDARFRNAATDLESTLSGLVAKRKGCAPDSDIGRSIVSTHCRNLTAREQE